MSQEKSGATRRLEELLEEFLLASATSREAFLRLRPEVSQQVRQATERLVREADEDPRAPLLGLRQVPLEAVEHLAPVESFYRLWGAAGPPTLAVFGEEPGVPERRHHVIDLLRRALDCEEREPALDLLDRLAALSDGLPGLGADFTCWLYLLQPQVFPPLPAGLFPGASEALGPARGPRDTVRRIWAFAEREAPLLETLDLAVAAAFFEWLSERGADAWSKTRGKGPYYGAERLVAETLLTATFVERLVAEVETTRLLLFTGPSGTGKTFTALRFARYLCRDGGSYEVLRAHAGLGYEQLVGDSRRPGILVGLAEAARRDPKGHYVLCLDGIDGIDVSAVFGDLLLALEYPDEEIVTSGGIRFQLPANLCLLATARPPWEELLRRDYALYRLFSHARFAPDPLKLAEFFRRLGDPLVKHDIVHLFRRLNRVMAERGSKDLQVGHGYLMVEGLNDSNLAVFWDSQILPYVRTLLGATAVDFEAFRIQRLG